MPLWKLPPLHLHCSSIVHRSLRSPALGSHHGNTHLFGIFPSQQVTVYEGPRKPEATVGSADLLVMGKGDLQEIALIFQSTCNGCTSLNENDNKASSCNKGQQRKFGVALSSQPAQQPYKPSQCFRHNLHYADRSNALYMCMGFDSTKQQLHSGIGLQDVTPPPESRHRFLAF